MSPFLTAILISLSFALVLVLTNLATLYEAAIAYLLLIQLYVLLDIRKAVKGKRNNVDTHGP